MRARSRCVWWATAACIVAAGCDRPLTVETPAPRVVADLPDSIPPLPESIVEAPIAYDLAPALGMLDSAVPRRFGSLADKRVLPSNRRVSLAFEASRSPFRVALEDSVVTISATISYAGRGWYKPIIGPEVSGGCDGDTRPRLRVTLISAISIDSTWRLGARTRIARIAPLTATPRDRCQVTLLKIDVTDRVIAAARSALARELRTLDREIARVVVRDRVERWWQAMARPIRLRDSLWLSVQPQRVALDRIETDSTSVIGLVLLTARPRIRSGPRPLDATPLLPPLRRARTSGSALYATLEGLLDYASASAELTRRLGGKTVRVGGRTVEITTLTLTGIGAGRVALGLSFTGDARGRVWLTGTPQYDTTARVLTVPDLDYDVGSATLLVKGIEWLKGVELRDFLRAQAHLSVDDLLEKARLLTERAMNRSLTEGVDLVTTIEQGAVIGVRASRETMVIRARAQGQAGLLITRAPPPSWLRTARRDRVTGATPARSAR
ncbi:MAG: DUF4403 family protein [Gemmatimonadaceae bacterium]|jgi:hypothetical protein|nr:DUF4403 family protein [Gemmatimonadaceae bacterium]